MPHCACEEEDVGREDRACRYYRGTQRHEVADEAHDGAAGDLPDGVGLAANRDHRGTHSGIAAAREPGCVERQRGLPTDSARQEQPERQQKASREANSTTLTSRSMLRINCVLT